MRINGIGTIPSYKKIIDIYSEKCSFCNNIVVFKLMESAKKFTMYWIPVAKLGKKYYVVCPICEHGHEISKEKSEELIKQFTRPIDK